MTNTHKILFGAPLVCLLAFPLHAGTLSRIRWTSNSGIYINDTIVDAATSPLAFTATNDLAQPFLNAADSTISLGYGSYFAITFRGHAHIGVGTISFLLDGVTTYTQNVTFPDPFSASGVFARFTLPDGDMVTVSATGYAADRIQVVADGGGLTGDGNPDAFYHFNYLRAADVIAPKLRIDPATPGFATLSWTPATPGFVLQQSVSLWPSEWSDSPSGATNPVVVPANLSSQFFRLIQP